MKFNVLLISFLAAFCPNDIYCQQNNRSFETLKTISGDFYDISTPVPDPVFLEHDPPGDKGVTNEIVLDILKELGKPPSKDEAVKIEQALNILSATKVGKEICKSIDLTGKTNCTWADLKLSKVEITTRDLNYHLPEPLESFFSYAYGSADLTAGVPPPSKVKGRTILCLDKYLISANSPAYIATFILHELSHISDNRTLGESTSTLTAQYATEYKGHLVHMMICDELLRTGKLKGNTATNSIQFMASVYHWKNGGPQPNRDYSITLRGKFYSAMDLVDLYAKPGDTRLKVVGNLTKFYTGLSEGTMDNQGLMYSLGIRKFIKELEPKYLEWFPSKPPAAANPSNNGGTSGNNGSNNGGSNNGGSGGSNGSNSGGNNNGGGTGISDDDDDDTAGDGDNGGGGDIDNPCPNPHFNPDGSAGC